MLQVDLTDKQRGRDRTDLARQIMIAVKNFTYGRPALTQHEMIAVMAYCVGVAIGNQPPEVDRGELIRLAGKMVADGEATIRKEERSSMLDIDAIVH